MKSCSHMNAPVVPTQLIGNTPLVKFHLQELSSRPRILAKAEFFNPTGSHKDRIYQQMIEKAEQRGELESGMTIVEGSTGNAGAACSMIGALKGYEVVVVMPEGMSEERKQLIKAFGAELITTPGGESDQDLSLKKVEEIVNSNPDQYWYPAQFSNPDNPQTHYETTGPELWSQSSGEIDALVLAVGSGGTLSGIGRYLTERNPEIKVYAVEPAECPILSQQQWGSHDIQGIGDGFVPDNLDLQQLEGVVTVSSEEAINQARNLCLKQGLVVGISTGCNIAAAHKVVKENPQLQNIATMLFDTGQKYFSSPLFGSEAELSIPDRQHQLEPDTRRLLDKYSERWEFIH